jgi:hypothetical protein
MDYQQTARTVLDAECAGAVIDLSFRAAVEESRCADLGWFAGCLDFARHDKNK